MTKAAAYLKQALAQTQPADLSLHITHGLAGSGKTSLSGKFLERGAVRLRTDVERKRRFGLAAMEASSKELKEKMYSPQTTQALYADLGQQAALLLEQGFPVIVDGTFLQREQRDIFRELAKRKKVPFGILSPAVAPEILRERVAARAQQGQDASEADLAVLELQLKTQEPLTAAEQREIVSFE